jgi:hypothetical protein
MVAWPATTIVSVPGGEPARLWRGRQRQCGSTSESWLGAGCELYVVPHAASVREGRSPTAAGGSAPDSGCTLRTVAAGWIVYAAVPVSPNTRARGRARSSASSRSIRAATSRARLAVSSQSSAMFARAGVDSRSIAPRAPRVTEALARASSVGTCSDTRAADTHAP